VADIKKIKRIERKKGPVKILSQIYEGHAAALSIGGVEFILVAPDVPELQKLYEDNSWAALNVDLVQHVILGSADRCIKG
jgi:hypothetical protein